MNPKPYALNASILVPETCDVVVIGGGPAGSSAATMMARDGFDVVVLEKETFPRPQVGESLLPHLWDYTDKLGVSEKIRAEGFMPKSGGIIAWDGQVHHLSFTRYGYTNPERVGLNVERDIFDDVLLRHSADTGAHIFQNVAVNNVDFSEPGQPIITYRDLRQGGRAKGRVKCRFVIDASGHASLLARQFGVRRLVSQHKKYLGLWGYFTGANYLGPDGQSHAFSELKEVKPVVFVTSFEDGWIWHITLREQTSVGLVINTDHVRGLGKAAQQDYFIDTVKTVPILRGLMAPASFVEGSLFFRPDYSYYSERITGPDFISIGDAGAFVDPIFSQGVQAAFFNAIIAAWTVRMSLRNEASRPRYAAMANMQMQKYYGFSRLLALGDFGAEAVDMKLVKSLMQGLPENELELALAAAFTTSRSNNLHRMLQESGMLSRFEGDFGYSKLQVLNDVLA